MPELTGLLDVENAVAGDPLIGLTKTWPYSVRDDTPPRPPRLLDGPAPPSPVPR